MGKMSKNILMLILVAGILLHDAFAIKRNWRGRRHLLNKRSPTEPSYSPDSNNNSPNTNNYSPNTNNNSPNTNNYSPNTNNNSPNTNNYSPNNNNYSPNNNNNSPNNKNYSPNNKNYSPNNNNYSPNNNNYSPNNNNYSPNTNNYSPGNSNGGDGRPNILADNYGTAASQRENDPQLCLQCPSNSLGVLGQFRTFFGNGLGVFTLLNSAIDEYSPLGAYLFSTIRSVNNFVTGCTNLNGILPTSQN